MVSLKLQKRLSASVLGCGLRKVRWELCRRVICVSVAMCGVLGRAWCPVRLMFGDCGSQVWLDPNEVSDISMANSREFTTRHQFCLPARIERRRLAGQPEPCRLRAPAAAARMLLNGDTYDAAGRAAAATPSVARAG